MSDSSSALAEVAAQRRSNASALAHFDAFASHRRALTAVACSHRTAPEQRICVLGAGNCYDLDLEVLTETFGSAHLVDLDEEAVTRARDRQPAAVRERIVVHAPVDLSALVDEIDRWKEMRVTPEELMRHPERAALRAAEALPGPFDVVLSACLLTQLQLFVLNVLSSSHRLFEATRQVVNLAHLRTLARLTAPGGRAILATDFVSNLEYPLDRVDPDGDVRALMERLIGEGHGIYAAHPGLLGWMITQDPTLAQSFQLSPPKDAWLWHNGAERLFLVYALSLLKR